MGIEASRIRKLLLVLLVVVSTLALSTSVLLGAHDHAQGPGSCHLCIAGHIAWLQPAGLASVLPPVMREWREISDSPGRILEPSEPETPSRAPPV